ncbi:uncharacterized protein LOC144914130 isoform X1 [Branchiostoma floridae x Branchiostoma belcheri]
MRYNPEVKLAAAECKRTCEFEDLWLFFKLPLNHLINQHSFERTTRTMSKKVIVLHDNEKWYAPMREALEAHPDLTVEEWVADEVSVDLSTPPPHAVFCNRTSSGAHVHGHAHSPDQAEVILAWAEAHDRPVVNPKISVQVGCSKALQCVLAKKYGVPVPKTICSVNPTPEQIRAAFGEDSAFVVKPDRGGSGKDVNKFESVALFSQAYRQAGDSGPAGFLGTSPTGLYIVQEFLPHTTGIYRAEFVDGRLLYVFHVQVSDSHGFNLCPCELQPSDYSIITDFQHPILQTFQNFLEGTGIHNSGFEFIFDSAGAPQVIDINTFSAYNREAERRAGVQGGHHAIAEAVRKRAQII